ncbi:MAG: hypothetical protein OIN85_00680 [Candidatus Methanoperedens sp.]|nr:hypothetical protein [Candidatus Methanoperedens sp.]
MPKFIKLSDFWEPRKKELAAINGIVSVQPYYNDGKVGSKIYFNGGSETAVSESVTEVYRMIKNVGRVRLRRK